MMNMTDLKIDTKRLLEDDDSRYFPGIGLILIPQIIFGIISAYFHNLTASDLIISIIAYLIATFFTCWFINGVANLIIKKKHLVGNPAKPSIFIPYIIISLIGYYIVQAVNTYSHKEFLVGFLITIIGLLITILFNIFIQLIVIESVKNNGSVNYGRVFSTFIKAIPSIIWLNITFIPLYILIGITFGILFFWKITYMEACCVNALVKIYEENN